MTGISSNIVALIPLGVLSVTGIFGKEKIKAIDWSVLWLVAAVSHSERRWKRAVLRTSC